MLCLRRQSGPIFKFTESEDEAIERAAGGTYPCLLRSNLHEEEICRDHLHSHRHRRGEGSEICRRRRGEANGGGARGSVGCNRGRGRGRGRGRRNGLEET